MRPIQTTTTVGKAQTRWLQARIVLLAAVLWLCGMGRLPTAFGQCGQAVGNTDFSPSNAPRLSLVAATLGGNDLLVASFADAAESGDLSAMVFNRTTSTWNYFGAPGFVDLEADVNNVPALQLTDGGVLLAAATDDADAGKAHLFNYDPDDGWIRLSASGGAGDGRTLDPAISFVPGVGAYMALSERGVGARAYLFDLNDFAFVEIGGGLLAPGDTKDFSVEVDDVTGTVYVAFLQRQGAGNYQVRVMAYDGTAFDDVGDPQSMFAAPGGTASANDLKLTLADGQPVVAFADVTVGNRITVARFDGSQWNVVGTRGVSDLVSSDADVAFRDGRIYIGYIDQMPGRPTPQARYFDGRRWVEACPGASSLGVGYWGTLAATQNNIYMGFVNLANERANVVSVPIIVNIQAGIATPDGTELNCSNSTLVLDGSVSSGAPSLAYAWSTGETTPSIVVATAGTYTLIVTDPATGLRDTASVTVTGVALAVAIDATVSELTDAQPTSVLSARASGGPSGATVAYRWSTGETTAAITVATAGTYTVTVDFLDPDDMIVLCSGRASVTVADNRGGGGNPDCARIVASATRLDCLSPTATLDASSSLGGNPGPATYRWSTGATTAAITVVGAGTYTVIVDAPTIGCLDTAAVTITTSEARAPEALIFAPGGGSLDCGSASVVLDGSDSSGDNDLSYRWSTGETEPTIEVMASGTYTLTVTDVETGCSASASFTVTGMNPGLLAAGFLVSADVCVGDSLHLIDYSVLEAMADVDFRWDFGDGTTSTERDPVHVYASPGSYTVDLEVSSGGCPPELISKPLEVVQCLRRKQGLGVAARIVPTMTRGPVLLEVELPEVGELHVSVVNISGQVVLSQRFDAQRSFREELLLRGCGQYFVQLRHGFGLTVLRVVVVE